MFNRDIGFYFVDIFIAFNKIARYTFRFGDLESFYHSELEWDAKIRELELLGEATKTLLNLNVINNKYIRIVDFRNQISHEYFGIDKEIIWDIVKNKLPEYIDELKEIVKDKNINLAEAIISAIEEKKFNKTVVQFLDKLRKELK
ncbi:MAG: DUF86 domain-containing protein [Candidatus Cloacimonetes bacterium]|nr:DUF86 domain-containing protein [Candidatus Cloacimonadota bacterium]